MDYKNIERTHVLKSRENIIVFCVLFLRQSYVFVIMNNHVQCDKVILLCFLLLDESNEQKENGFLIFSLSVTYFD